MERDRRFALDTRGGPLGTVPAYVAHMRLEITTGLPPSAQRIVVQQAAKVARTRVLAALANLHAPGTEMETALADRWCEQVANAVITRLIELHDTRHNALDRTIELAKTP